MTKLSILDRSLVRQGQDPAQALRDTVAFARQAEELGYHRFWVSEHHAVPGVAGSAPTVLAAAVAAATSRIRVGTGGVMLPNHQPLVVAEQFGVLDALHPGRIDMGLGRSVGFTGGIRKALGHDKKDADDFRAQIEELLDFFTTGRHGVHAMPSEGRKVPAFVLAIGSGADIAAELGLPLVIGGGRVEEGVRRYRDTVKGTPYVIVAANIAVGPDAHLLQLPEAWATVHSRTRGVFPPLRPVAEIQAMTPTERERGYLDEALRGQIHGTEDQVAAQLRDLVERTGADEVLVTMNTYDLDRRLDSYRRLISLRWPTSA
ncbi:MsnO8 family LLM class oxidoreductase [Nonomuraea sp. NPDC059194]|uniref:MsnO8 family LLM class oxidoreductase n=1 Tax=Nonomuraea sp. NPDC059194 TaxID=3346764 RepID=UPI00367D75EE